MSRTKRVSTTQPQKVTLASGADLITDQYVRIGSKKVMNCKEKLQYKHVVKVTTEFAKFDIKKLFTLDSPYQVIYKGYHDKAQAADVC